MTEKKPVLFLLFNRPHTAAEVFAAIRQYRPQRLYLAADGPRSHVADDGEKCAAARAVTANIDWPCKTERLFRPQNSGCRLGVAAAIDWFFQQEEAGIILEDDCLPSPDFFRFCSLMLDRYCGCEKVMHIAGVNFQDGIRRGEGAYYFSRIPHVWGWATWKRAWEKYDVNMADFPGYFQENRIADSFPAHEYRQWRFLRMFRKTYEKSPYFNTWDCQWSYTVLKNRGFCVNPNYNMVTNIGGSGTHTVDSKLCGRIWQPLPEALPPPGDLVYDDAADAYTFQKIYRGNWKDYVRYCLSKVTRRDWM